MIALRVMAVSLALLGSAAGQVTQTKAPDTTKEMLIGAWDVTKVQDADKQKLTVGSTVVFGNKNKVKIMLIQPTIEISFEGTWSLDKDEVIVSFPRDGKTVSQAIKIIKVTDDNLITTNGDGLTIEYEKRKKTRID